MHILCHNVQSKACLSDRRMGCEAMYMVLDAQERASARGLFGRISPLILLWTMLRWERKAPITLLERCGVDVTAITALVDDALSQAKDGMFVPVLDFTPLAELVHEAQNHATRRGENKSPEAIDDPSQRPAG
jgi:hypothetical protein